ncbi:MAG: hypothetical protein AAF728_16260 [Cyanobacteria bacterium P01_D01_bin.128]
MNRLATRIREELGDIQLTINRAMQGWQKFTQSTDELYIDGIALNIQGAYTGLERLFEQISKHVDDERSQGENWHQKLLQQMAVEQDNIRPAVISIESLQYLDNWRRFRHLVRHNYASKLEISKIEKLIEGIDYSFGQISAELMAFAQFLEQRSES